MKTKASTKPSLGSRSFPTIVCRLALGALVALAACSDNGDYYPGVSAIDSGPPSRAVSDADFRDTLADSAPDTSTDGAVSDGGDGSTGDSAPALKITIDVLNPLPAAVVPALQKFTPKVDVTVDAPAMQAGDTLKDVTADVVLLPGQTVAASGKLNQVSLDTVPESSSLVYHFADTPIDLSMLASGNYQLQITAHTNGGAMAMTTVAFQIDGGPAIRIDSPVQDQSYKGSASIDVTISDDFFAPVSDVEMKIGQTAVPFAGPGGTTGKQYTGTLDFSSFMPALEGDQILTVRAKNKNGTESVLTRKFVSDSKGPTFANPVPKDGDLVGNVITISVDVSDPAGVLNSSVVAVFANGPGNEYTIPLQPPAAGAAKPTYSAVFDTRLLPFGENALFPTLSFRASDTLGNEALISSVVWLDNRPPLGDLDPPDMRILTKNEGGNLACSWPFDPVGPDAADDGDLVPQIANIRARIEDQGNVPLSGDPKYIPIAGVDTAQLLVLDDISQPLVVNTNPTPKGNLKADSTCDALNPLLVPTTRPMTARDALLITLTPIVPAGTPDLTNTQFANVFLEGDDLSCVGGGNAKVPDSICEATYNGAKAKWRINTATHTVLDAHSDSLSVILGYAAGGGTGQLPSIYTIPKQEAGATDPLCAGTQFDSLANFVNDGWACLALFTTDKLGNKQVSRPLRLCVDKDNDGKECPHKAVSAVIDGTPLTVQTVADHGYATGDKVVVSGVTMLTPVNGTWTITVTGPRSFTLDGSVTSAVGGIDWNRPNPPLSRPNAFIPGYVVRSAEIPSCTGTQTADQPVPVVDANTPCDPWSLYSPGELRRY